MTIGVAPVRCVTDNSIQGLWKNEERLDSIWCKEDIWNKGATPINTTQTIHEPSRWAKWDYDLERYYVSQMKYPEELLKKNVSGYSVVMFSIDTLGLPRAINILTSIQKEFDKEVIIDQRTSALSAMSGQRRQTDGVSIHSVCTIPTAALQRKMPVCQLNRIIPMKFMTATNQTVNNIILSCLQHLSSILILVRKF